MPTIFRASLALIPVFLLACSSDAPVADAGPGNQVCPSTIIQATAAAGEDGVTSKCHVANYTCVVGFECTNTFFQQATCVCDGNAFACTLASDGSAVPPEVTDPTTLCKSIDADSGDACPADKTKADGTACKNQGQQCTYQSACTTQPAPLDVCQCKGNQTGDAGLSWACELNCQ